MLQTLNYMLFASGLTSMDLIKLEYQKSLIPLEPEMMFYDTSFRNKTVNYASFVIWSTKQIILSYTIYY